MQTMGRNRYLIAGAVVVGGLLLAKKHPAIGVGLAGGAAAMAIGSPIALAILKVIPAYAVSPSTPQTVSGIGQVFANNMRGLGPVMSGYSAAMGQVFANNMRGLAPAGIGQVFANNMRGMGNAAPLAPWQTPGPFGY